jgi:hypothetical protein
MNDKEIKENKAHHRVAPRLKSIVRKEGISERKKAKKNDK